MTRRCKCEHWQDCPTCAPQRFDADGKRKPAELYRAQTPLTDAEITALLPTWQRGSWTLPDYGRWVARAVERAHGIKTSHNLCLSCGHSIDAHDRQYGCAEDGCDCETPNAEVTGFGRTEDR